MFFVNVIMWGKARIPDDVEHKRAPIKLISHFLVY